jgi:hypothetical protein
MMRIQRALGRGRRKEKTMGVNVKGGSKGMGVSIHATEIDG